MKKLAQTATLLALMAPHAPALAQNPALIGIPNVGQRPAPTELTLDAYSRWVEPIVKGQNGDDPYSSAFAPLIFSWFEKQANAKLPSQVQSMPDKIYVDVANAKAQTIALENSGDIPKWTAAGGDVYAELQGTVDQALEAQLNVWGKPVGQKEGSTKPTPNPFSKRKNYLAPNPLWGDGAFVSLEIRRNGGIIRPLTDRYLLLVRGDSQKGYDVLMQYIGPGGDTKTTNVLAIAVIRPISDGKVAFKISSRYQGQNYLGFQDAIAFNPDKIHEIQLGYVQAVNELRKTGKITDHDNDL